MYDTWMFNSMNMQISATEQKWLDALFKECSTHFRNIHLPSHNHYHHFRVWSYAKELILTLAASGIAFPDDLVEEIIFAVFFHDAGMSVTMDENHGKFSAEMFQDFIAGKTEQFAGNREEVYEAIESHDRKNYEEVPFEKAFDRRNILSTILNISDDLDAFGYIGIYRYLEIYLMRGIQPDQLAGRVLMNLEKRFSNISSTLGKIASFVNNHRSRYRKTVDFFNDLSETGFNADSSFAGPSGVVKLVRDQVIKKQTTLENIIESNEPAIQDEYVRNYLSNYRNEEYPFIISYPNL